MGKLLLSLFSSFFFPPQRNLFFTPFFCSSRMTNVTCAFFFLIFLQSKSSSGLLSPFPFVVFFLEGERDYHAISSPPPFSSLKLLQICLGTLTVSFM